MVQIVMSDKTKPHQFRASTFFTTYMQEEKFRSVFGAADPVDQPVTMAISDFSAQNAFMKCKGQMVTGHHTGEALLTMMANAIPTAASPGPAAPAKSPLPHNNGHHN